MSLSEVHDLKSLKLRLLTKAGLFCTTVQNVDVTPIEEILHQAEVNNAVFLGCTMSDHLMASLVKRGAIIFPELKGVPYDPYRTSLYTHKDLFAGFDRTEPCSYCDTPDAKIYRHWRQHGRHEPDTLMEGLARKLHDMSITEAVHSLIDSFNVTDRIAVMGGHSTGRDELVYRQVAEISRTLTRQGKLMMSGGGPGCMEATHLGAMLSDHDDTALDGAIDILSKAPSYRDEDWLTCAYKVIETYGDTASAPSLGIPTWHYGHEPPSAFASHIAKYFSNAIREEGLISMAIGGLIVAPGSAGTIQEVFQDAAQNHYKTTGWVSPMVFLDKPYWTQEKAIYPLLKALSEDKEYGPLVGVGDTADEIIRFLQNNPAKKVQPSDFSYCEIFCREG